MKPIIFEYSTAHSYFKDFYNYKKTVSALALRQWTDGMGFESPTLVLDLLKGKRPLKLKFVAHLAKGMELNELERTYFKTLVLLQNAHDEEKSYLEEVLESLKPKDIFLDIEDGLYSHWLPMVILTMSQINEAYLSSESIQKSLKQQVPLKTVKMALELLVRHDLLENLDNDMYKVKTKSAATTPNDVMIKSSHNYYEQVLAKAKTAISLDVHEREFQCFAVGMKKENLIRAKEIIRKARTEITSFAQEDADHVYQFNFNGFPMAEIP